jgi:hypothetical protein
MGRRRRKRKVAILKNSQGTVNRKNNRVKNLHHYLSIPLTSNFLSTLIFCKNNLDSLKFRDSYAAEFRNFYSNLKSWKIKIRFIKLCEGLYSRGIKILYSCETATTNSLLSRAEQKLFCKNNNAFNETFLHRSVNTDPFLALTLSILTSHLFFEECSFQGLDRICWGKKWRPKMMKSF